MTMYDRIRELRIKNGMTQEDLAHAMGYKDRSMITKIEAGKVDISQSKIDEFARVLGTTTSYLMGWDEAPKMVLTQEIRMAVKTEVMAMLFNRLNAADQDAVMKYAEFLEQKEGGE